MTGTYPAPRPAVRDLVEDAIGVRRELHRHAELSTEEWHTQEVILSWLRSAGVEDVAAIADTGVTGIVLGGRPGPNLLWRADIDGLPLAEATGLAFASQNPGAMHACGHDGHTAIALAMASALAAARASLAGSVRFAFQPAEEHVGGARRMIEQGIMRDPKVERVFGLHILADYPVGEVRIAPGAVFAAATHFRTIIRGSGGHASAPHQAVVPIVVAAQAIVALQTVVSRNVPAAEAAVLTVGRIQGGVRGNIIPDEVMMSGTIRTFNPEVQVLIVARVDEILRGVTGAMRATYQFDHSTLPACVNDPACAALVERVAVGFLGPDRVAAARLTGADDMAAFLEAAPGAYLFLGGRNESRGIVHPHHSPGFNFDEACIPLGIELGLRIIEAAGTE